MRDVLILRRSTQVAQALLIVVAAYAAAVTVNSSVALWLESGTPDLPISAPTKQDPRDVASVAARADNSVILERNLFGSEPIAVADSRPGPAPAGNELRLRGTAELDGKGFAVFEDPGAGKQDVFGIGERVFGGAKLVSVRPGSATMSQRGRKFTLEISTEQAAPRSPRSKNGDGAAAPAGGGIRKTGENAYLVDRREVDHSIENLNSVITQMRAVPFLKDGKGIGFRIFNIRSGSVFERMGLKNGDVVQSVNGIELTTPSKAIGLLEDMQTAGEIKIDLLRAGAPRSMSYTVQ